MGLELSDDDLVLVVAMSDQIQGDGLLWYADEPLLQLVNRIRAHLGLPPDASREDMAADVDHTEPPDGYVRRLVDGVWKNVPTARRQRDPLADIYANPDLFEPT